MTGRERILATLDGRPVDRLPFMPISMTFAAKQAGIPYLSYATDYRALVEGQLRFAESFEVDYVNTMSDPAGEAADCGAQVRFFPDQPPALDESCALLADKGKLSRLRVPEPDQGPRMRNRLHALELYRSKVGREKLIEGWIEGPIAQAADLRGLNSIMLDFYDDHGFIADLFEFVLDLELRFARAQILAGAEMIGIGDAAASLVGLRTYAEFVWPFEKRLVDAIKAMGARVRLHVCGATRSLLMRFGALGCDVVDMDSLSPMNEARKAMGSGQVLLGNIDPVRTLFRGDPAGIERAIKACHREAGSRYIVSAGCEVPRDTPVENLRAMQRYAKEHRADEPSGPLEADDP